MPNITCIRDCLIPGKGLVEAGEVVELPDDTTQPWLKHFKTADGNSALKSGEREKEPKKSVSKPEKEKKEE